MFNARTTPRVKGNRLVGVWYNNGDMSDPNEQVAAYEYDGLFRRIEKVVGNQGTGIVHGSERPDDPNDPDLTGIQAGNQHEHYYYTGWRLLEMRDGSDDTLGQFVYGTQYIDEPLRYDRNTDVDSDNNCLESDGSRAYYYHQDTNFRVVMLTDEDGAVVERYRYTAYGEPAVFGGSDGSGAELANATFVSLVGNPLMHQGLFRDAETGLNYNRVRIHHARLGRFMQRDPLGYIGGLGRSAGIPMT